MGGSEGYYKGDKKGYPSQDRASGRSLDPSRRDRERTDGSER
jgi:hypothetical protein